jgi:electron transport complex protein RnfC
VGADTILAKVLTRRETPPGESTMAVGVAIVDAATCFALYRLVACGQRATGRVATIGGPCVAEPGNVWAPFGARCGELAGGGEGMLVHGGAMGGMRCDALAVVTPATNALLTLEPVAPPVPSPCIRCGWCTDLCPARLNVAALNDAFELSLVERARRAGALACVECGVCSYVCPARLPLTQRVKRLKRQIRALGALAGATREALRS